MLPALVALLLCGCESVVLKYVNRGLAPPAATEVYAPESGLAMDVYRPTGQAPRQAPVVVFFHGGSWRRGSRSQYRFVGQRLAGQGIVAVVADYRTFPRAGFPAFVEDAARAVKRARDRASEWGGDPARLYVAGHSAGAQIAALLATDGRYLRAQGMAPGELAGVIGLSGPYDFEVTGDLAEVFGPRANWPLAQAIAFVDGDEPPFLLVHGTGDSVVEHVDSIQLAERLRRHGVPATLLLLPGEGHVASVSAFYDPARAPAVLPAVRDFVHGRAHQGVAAPANP